MNNLLRVVPGVLFSAYLIKGIGFGLTWADSIAILAVTTLIIFERYYSENKKIKDFEAKMKTYEADIALLNNKIQGLNDNLGKFQLGGMFKTK